MCVGVLAHAHFASDIELSSQLPLPSPYIFKIFFILGGGGGV